MRITIRGVRSEVLESTREAGKAVATRVRYDVLLSDEPRSQWRACFKNPASYAEDFPSQYTFGKQRISFECSRSEAKRLFDELVAYVRQANAKSGELEDLSEKAVPRMGARSHVSEGRLKEQAYPDEAGSKASAKDLAALGREIEEETSSWLSGTEEEK